LSPRYPSELLRRQAHASAPLLPTEGERMAGRYDLVILGGGTAAFSAAIRADRNRARALMIDRGPIGGTCVNVGCVPSKRLLAVGDQFFRVANHPFPGLGFENGWSSDFPAIMRAKDRLVASLRKRKYQDVLASLKDLERREHPFRSECAVRRSGATVVGPPARVSRFRDGRPETLPRPSVPST
jgi:hypothetical protein